MPVSPQDFTPSASNWFATSSEYAGRCKAEFASPAGSVEGPATVSISDVGEVSVRMEPEAESLMTEVHMPYGLRGFLGGEGYVQEKGSGFTNIDLTARNSCSGLTVSTSHGVFSTDDVPIYGTQSVMDSGGVNEINFEVGLSHFEVSDQTQPVYWVLPLVNFLSECRQHHSELDRHPLRIYSTPTVPDEITYVPFDSDYDKRSSMAMQCLLVANDKNRLIQFELKEGLGFIERLPDYGDREQLLLEGKERWQTTAVMVGPVGERPAEDLDHLRTWFSFDLLSLLTLATGTEVGAPCIELRDARGHLVRRLHGKFGVRPFRKGRRLIEEKPMRSGGIRATGRLIECALTRSDKFGESFLRAAIVHLVRARHDDLSLDDGMSHVSRGLETLCKRFGVSSRRLDKDLSSANRAEVEAILKEASDRLKSLSRSGGTAPGSLSIDRIAQKARAADQKDNAFGVSVSRLLRAFWLPDAHILEQHYRHHETEWGTLLSRYRGDVTHHGYLDILGAGHDIYEIADVVFHLHDVLARLILKILRFDGGYRPASSVHDVIPVSADWVKPHFSAYVLGYGRREKL